MVPRGRGFPVIRDWEEASGGLRGARVEGVGWSGSNTFGYPLAPYVRRGSKQPMREGSAWSSDQRRTERGDRGGLRQGGRGRLGGGRTDAERGRDRIRQGGRVGSRFRQAVGWVDRNEAPRTRIGMDRTWGGVGSVGSVGKGSFRHPTSLILLRKVDFAMGLSQVLFVLRGNFLSCRVVSENPRRVPTSDNEARHF